MDKEYAGKIIKDVVEDIDFERYLEASPNLRKTLNGDKERARHHFVHNGFYEMFDGKRRLYPNVPLFRKLDYQKENQEVIELVAKGEYHTPYHYFLRRAVELDLNGFNEDIHERLNTIYTFYTEPFLIDFRNNIYTGQPQGRYVKILVDGNSRINYQGLFVQVNGKAENQIVSKKVYINSLEEYRVHETGDSITIPYGTSPYFIIDLGYNCFLDVISFFIKNIEIEKQSNIRVLISGDMEGWYPIYTVDSFLTRKRIGKILLEGKNSFVLEGHQNIFYLNNNKNILYSSDSANNELRKISSRISNIFETNNVDDTDKASDILSGIREELRDLYKQLPITTDFSSLHNRILRVDFEKVRDSIIVAIPSKEYRKISLALFKGEMEVEMKYLKRMENTEEIAKDIYGKGLIKIDPGSFYGYYSYFEVRGDLFDRLLVYNEENLSIFSQEWFVFDGRTHELLYNHHALYKVYRQLYMLTNIYLKRDADDIRYLMGTYVMSSRHADVFTLFRNYSLDKEPSKKQLDSMHEEVKALAGSSIYSRFKILTKHGIQESIKRKDPLKLTLAMKEVQTQFLEWFSLDCIPFYGTLLGMIRDGDFIAHDDDVDMIYLGRANGFEEMLIEREKVINGLKSFGFKILNIYNTGDYNFHVMVGKLHIDIFPSFMQDDGYAFFSSGKVKVAPLSDMLPLGKMKFYDMELKIPNRSQELMRIRYGDGWDVPNRNFGFVCVRGKNYYIL